MATTFFGTVKTRSTSLSLDVLLLKTADNTAETGLTYSSGGLSAYYYRQGASGTTSISLVNRSTLDAAYSSGGFLEIVDGSYRLDAPDAMWVDGAQWVELTVKTANSLYKERFTLEAHGADDVFGLIGTAGAGLTALGDSRLANLDATITSRSTYAGGAVASVINPVTIGMVTDKAGYSLAATGLDLIPVTDPGGVSGQTTFPKILVALYRRFFKKSTLTATELKTYADDGSTVRTTQAVSDDSTTQTQGAAT